MATAIQIANRALAEAGQQSEIASFTDGTPEAIYINLLYAGLRDFLLREGDYDFAMVALAAEEAAPAVVAPWKFAYKYPANCVRVRQLLPVVLAANDPRPVTWNIFSLGGVQVIGTFTAISSLLYTSNEVPESFWDALFVESFVRLLASALVYAIGNHVEASKEALSTALSVAGIANMRDS